MFSLINNQIIFNNESKKAYRVIDNDDTNYYCIQLSIRRLKILKYEKSEIRKLLMDETILKFDNNVFVNNSRLNKEEFSSKSIKCMKERYKVIEFLREENLLCDFIRFKGSRSMIVELIMSKLSCKKTHIYKIIRIYLQGGCVKKTLLPDFDNCGGKGIERKSDKKLGRPSYCYINEGKMIGKNLDAKDKKNIIRCIKKMYRDNCSLRNVYEYMICKYYVNVPFEELLTFYAFKKIVYKYFDNSELTRIKNGKYKNRLNNAVINNNTVMTSGRIGVRFEIDATIIDVHIISSIDRKNLVGRCTLYFVVDSYSKAIVGYNLSLNSPSFKEAMIAIYNCSQNKVEYCKSVGIEIKEEDWIQQGLPVEFLCDRGELISKYADEIVEKLDIQFSYTRSLGANMKANVETRFNMINKEIKGIVSGSINKSYRERMEKDYRKEAALTMQDLRKIVIESIILFNKRHYNKYPDIKELTLDEVPSIPNEIWKWGLNKTCSLIDIDSITLKKILFSKGKAAITNKGIIFNKLIYVSENKFIKDKIENSATTKQQLPINVYYREDYLDKIYYFDPEGNEIECNLHNNCRVNIGEALFLYEVNDYYKKNAIKNKKYDYINIKNNLEYKAKIININNEARDKKQVIDTKITKTNVFRELEKNKDLLNLKRDNDNLINTNNNESNKLNKIYLDEIEKIMDEEDE